MATFPDALEMRDLKYGKRTDEERDRVALRLREAGRRSEAILLYEGRGEHAFLEEERRWAVEEGRGFHLLALKRLGVALDEAAIEGCARAAEARGRWLEARQCWLALEGREAEIRRVAEHLPPSLRSEAEEAEAGEPGGAPA